MCRNLNPGINEYANYLFTKYSLTPKMKDEEYSRNLYKTVFEKLDIMSRHCRNSDMVWSDQYKLEFIANTGTDLGFKVRHFP